MKKSLSQRTEVLGHLQKYGKITSKEAFELYGITRLSAIIYVLKDWKYLIRTEMAQTVNRYGDNCNYAVYIYEGQEPA